MEIALARDYSVPVAELLRRAGLAWPHEQAKPEAIATGVVHDSRAVTRGVVFVGRRGARDDGARFASEALERGASLVVSAGPLGARSSRELRVEDPPLALARLATAFYGNPWSALRTVGITGTNGKTTSTWIYAELMRALGHPIATVGTLGCTLGGQTWVSGHTTPEADDLCRFAAHCVERGATDLVMEVSSHALSEQARRTDGVVFQAAAFTNLSQDHLDYHGTMAAYGAAKTRLFTELDTRAAVVVVDDVFGANLAEAIRPRFQHRLCTVSSRPEGAPATLHARATEWRLDGIISRLDTPAGARKLRLPLLGQHNLDNALVALGSAMAVGVDLDRALAALPEIRQVPGRLERCDDPTRDDVRVFVDYAHTPDALDRVLQLLAHEGEVWCVFGCGGDRDRTKRPEMGRAAARHAAVCYLTSDNPRSEVPAAILEDVLPGMQHARGSVRAIVDRREAIREAVLQAPAGATVLVAGKGHETYQIIGSQVLPFDDREEARGALEARRRKSGGVS